MKPAINSQLRELHQVHKLLLEQLAKAKSLYANETRGHEESTVRGALKGIQELIEEEWRKSRKSVTH